MSLLQKLLSSFYKWDAMVNYLSGIIQILCTRVVLGSYVFRRPKIFSSGIPTWLILWCFMYMDNKTLFQLIGFEHWLNTAQFIICNVCGINLNSYLILFNRAQNRLALGQCNQWWYTTQFLRRSTNACRGDWSYTLEISTDFNEDNASLWNA